MKRRAWSRGAGSGKGSYSPPPPWALAGAAVAATATRLSTTANHRRTRVTIQAQTPEAAASVGPRRPSPLAVGAAVLLVFEALVSATGAHTPALSLIVLILAPGLAL